MQMIIIGHRGARGLAAENTIASLKAASKNNPGMIEFDVRVTADQVPILFHDRDLDGTPISKTSYHELKAAKPDLATLAEALKFINSNIPLYIEVKPGVNIEAIVQQLKKYPGEYYIASKSQRTLRSLHKALPRVPTIVIEPWSFFRAVWRARLLRTKFIAMNKSTLWFGLIHNQSKSGWKLIAYTVNNPGKAQSWQKFGLYGVVTDYPDRFKKF